MSDEPSTLSAFMTTMPWGDTGELPEELKNATTDDVYGKFVRTDLIGKGAMGEVWKAYDLSLGRWVALKFVKLESEADCSWFRREVGTLATVIHPNIATIFETCEDRACHFIVMQYVDGHNLEQAAPANPREVARLIRDAARAVGEAHAQGIVHRDLKPGNLMVDQAGKLYVMDFGLAYIMDSASPHQRETAGTPDFMSPNQLMGRPANPRDDVYGLGKTMLALMPKNPVDVPGRLKAIMRRCIAQDENARYADAGELADELDRFLAPSRRWTWAAVIMMALAVGIVTTSSVFETSTAAEEAADTWSRTGELSLQQNDDKAALSAFTKSLALRPIPRTYLLRGFSYWRLCEFEMAIADCDAALKLDPANAAAKKNRQMAIDQIAKRSR